MSEALIFVSQEKWRIAETGEIVTYTVSEDDNKFFPVVANLSEDDAVALVWRFHNNYDDAMIDARKMLFEFASNRGWTLEALNAGLLN
jgi:hypothetical protein